MWRNAMKSKHKFLFTLKNLACIGLTPSSAGSVCVENPHIVIHYNDVTWVLRHVKSPVTGLFVQQPIQANDKEKNQKLCITVCCEIPQKYVFAKLTT